MGAFVGPLVGAFVGALVGALVGGVGACEGAMVTMPAVTIGVWTVIVAAAGSGIGKTEKCFTAFAKFVTNFVAVTLPAAAVTFTVISLLKYTVA